MYSIFVIFASIPLLFSHFFARFGEDFIIKTGYGNFESVKVPLFLSLLFLVTCEKILKEKEFFSRKTMLVLTWLIGVWGVSYGIYNERWSSFLFGIGEKQHGILLILGLIWLWYLLSFASKKEQSILNTIILFSWGIVACISLIEGIFGYNIFTGTLFQTTGSWWDVRSTATLGNPNYVAGYLLILIPLALAHIKRWEKYLLIALLFTGILMTKSVIGVSLALAFLVFLIGKHFLGKRIYIVFPLILITLLSLVLYRYSESDKWLSLISRFVLMKETIVRMLEHPLHTIFGYGPNGMIKMYEWVRSGMINAYFPPNMTIDSSHNMFLDIAVKYWLVGLSVLIGYIAIRWWKLETWAKYGLTLAFLFFSLNVIVVSHMLLIVSFLMAEKHKR